MGWLKNLLTGSPKRRGRKPLLKTLLSGSRKPRGRKTAKLPATSAPAKTPKVVPCDFIDLTENEAFLICEMIGKVGMSNDSRMTIKERLVEAVEDEIGPPTNLCMLLYWDKHELDAAGLPERLKSLSSRQAQCIITAADRFWELEEEGDLSETQELIEVGLVSRPI